MAAPLPIINVLPGKNKKYFSSHKNMWKRTDINPEAFSFSQYHRHRKKGPFYVNNPFLKKIFFFNLPCQPEYFWMICALNNGGELMSIERVNFIFYVCFMQSVCMAWGGCLGENLTRSRDCSRLSCGSQDENVKPFVGL